MSRLTRLFVISNTLFSFFKRLLLSLVASFYVIMLTYNLSFNNVISIPPLKKIVSAKIVECLWDTTTFIPEDLRETLEITYWKDVLAKQREQTISDSNALTEVNNLPSTFKTVFKESIFSRSRSYSQVLRWKRNYDPNNEMGSLKASLFDARKYFTVDGEWDDLAWTKRAVFDPVYPITCRFFLACKYCLENESAVLWSELKNNYGYMRDMFYRMDLIVLLWMFQLENQLESLVENNWEVIFKKAALSGYEYATRYFWKKMAEPEKITEDEMFFHLIEVSVCFEEKVAVFLYSQLSKERKQNFLDRSIGTGGVNVWVKLLLSPYTVSERSEIIELVYKLPYRDFSLVLAEIAQGIKEHSYPLHREEVFKALWTPLSPEYRGKILEERPYLIRILVETNSFRIVDYIKKGLSPEEKFS